MLNYMEQPWSANLDYASGAFAYHFSLKQKTNYFAECLFERGYHNGTAYSGARVRCEVTPTGLLKATYTDGTNTVTQTSTNAVNSGQWLTGVFVGFDGTNFRMAANGLDIATPVARGSVGSLTNTNAVLRIGMDLSGNAGAYNASLADFRSTATFPSNDQMAKIARDELPLFQPNAQCVIDGTSAAVTALAYDEDTDMLHVGTSWGRTAFQGLQRIESAVTSSGAVTSISAGSGSHITGGASSGRFAQPALNMRDELRRKSEARSAIGRIPTTFRFTGDGVTTTFALPKGYEPKQVYKQGLYMTDGGADYTTSYDGFAWSVAFLLAPLNLNNINILGARSA